MHITVKARDTEKSRAYEPLPHDLRGHNAAQREADK